MYYELLPIPQTPMESALNAPEIQFESIRQEIERLCHYRSIVAGFFDGKSSAQEQMDMIKREFSDSPEVMNALGKAALHCMNEYPKSKGHLADTTGFTWEVFMGRDVIGLSNILYGPISNYVRNLESKVGQEIASILLSDLDFNGISKLANQFIGRDDLEKPFADHRWNWHRVLPVDINGRNYEVTLVISPDSGMRTSFLLNNGEMGHPKNSATVDLKPLSHQMETATPIDEFKQTLVSIGLGSALSFIKQQQRLNKIRSGEAYPTIDVLGTTLQLLTKAPLTDREAYPDPMAAYALSLELENLTFENSGINAMEYAACSPGMTMETLQTLPHKPAEFVYYTMLGFVNLLKHVLLESNGNSGTLRSKLLNPKQSKVDEPTFDARAQYKEAAGIAIQD